MTRIPKLFRNVRSLMWLRRNYMSLSMCFATPAPVRWAGPPCAAMANQTNRPLAIDCPQRGRALGWALASASDVPAPPYYCTSAPHAILSTDGPESTHESPRHCAGALKWGTGLRNFSSRTEQLRWLARFATPVLARIDCERRKNA